MYNVHHMKYFFSFFVFSVSSPSHSIFIFKHYIGKHKVLIRPIVLRICDIFLLTKQDFFSILADEVFTV